jgi:hypothetical protein
MNNIINQIKKIIINYKLYDGNGIKCTVVWMSDGHCGV